MTQEEVSFEQLSTADLIPGTVYRGGRKGNRGDDPLPKLMKCENQGGFRRTKGAPYYTLFSFGDHPVWPDRFDPSTSLYMYYGDNKDPRHTLLDTRGNPVLKRTFDELNKPTPNRGMIRPFFIFTRGPQGSDVCFVGLAAPGARETPPSQALQIVVGRTEDGQTFQNYLATFTILDGHVPRAWLEELAAGDVLTANCPESWRRWVTLGDYLPLNHRQESFAAAAIQTSGRLDEMGSSRGRSFDNVWLEIRTKAKMMELLQAPLYSLDALLPSYILNVEAETIWTAPTATPTSDPVLLRKNEVESIWNGLHSSGSTGFDHSSSLAATFIARLIPGVSWSVSPLRLLISDPQLTLRRFRPAATPTSGGSHSGGEGERHRRLKEAIARQPTVMVGEPLTLVGMEYIFDSGDRVDLLFIDRVSRYVCIEVEPEIRSGDMVPFLQAGKYRVLTAMTFGVDINAVRTIVAAPLLNHEIWGSVAERYGLELRNLPDIPE